MATLKPNSHAAKQETMGTLKPNPTLQRKKPWAALKPNSRAAKQRTMGRVET